MLAACTPRALGDVARRLYDGAEDGRVGRRVPAQPQLGGYDIGAVLAPPAHVLLLQSRPGEFEAGREERALVGLGDPRQEEGDVVPRAREVGGAEQRVDRGAGHPRQRRRRDDRDVPAGAAQVGRRSGREHGRERRGRRQPQAEGIGRRRLPPRRRDAPLAWLRPLAAFLPTAPPKEGGDLAGGDRVRDVHAHVRERAHARQLRRKLLHLLRRRVPPPFEVAQVRLHLRVSTRRAARRVEGSLQRVLSAAHAARCAARTRSTERDAPRAAWACATSARRAQRSHARAPGTAWPMPARHARSTPYCLAALTTLTSYEISSSVACSSVQRERSSLGVNGASGVNSAAVGLLAFDGWRRARP